MRYYIVEHTKSDWNNIFVAKANNKKEAIDIVFNEHLKCENTQELKDKGYDFFHKNELVAEKLEDRFKEEDSNYICLH